MKGKPMKLSDKDKGAIISFVLVVWLLLSPFIALLIDDHPVTCAVDNPDCDASYALILVVVSIVIPFVVGVMGIMVYIALDILNDSDMLVNPLTGAKLIGSITRDTWRQFRAINNDELFEDES